MSKVRHDRCSLGYYNCRYLCAIAIVQYLCAIAIVRYLRAIAIIQTRQVKCSVQDTKTKLMHQIPAA